MLLAYKKSGMPFRQIGRKLRRSHNVVMNFYRNPLNDGQNKKGGPKQKLSGRFHRRILRLASISDKSLNQVKEELLLTIHQVIRRSKHIRRQKFKTPPRLLQRHKIQRNFFARNNIKRNWNQLRPLKPFVFFIVCYILR